MIRHVPRRRHAPDPGHDLRVTYDWYERHLLEIMWQIARLRALVGVTREFELAFLDHVRRLREAQLRRTVGRWDGRTVRRLVGRLAIGIAAGVIEMEMGIDHPANVIGPVSELRERVFDLGRPVLPLIHDAVDVPKLVVLFVSQARVDQDEPVAVLDQEAAQREGDAIAIIGGDAALPQRLRYHAEHRAAVEALRAALQGMTLQSTDRERRGGHQDGIEIGNL